MLANITGALYEGNGHCAFTVWAPGKKSVTLHLGDGRKLNMEGSKTGYFSTTADNITPGCRYRYLVDEGEFPDPASFFQPEGVHGSSEVVDHQRFPWTDGSWRGIPLGELVLYELHVGTFTPEGSFDAIIPRLNALRQLGINAIELMPVGQFPGNRNWGYDGAYPYAVQNSYGGPEGFKRLVDACHAQGIAVFLDVVYNHLGPEGNYFSSFGPYFSSKYHMPWGEALNFDGEWCDGVREYFSNNAVYWFDHFHLDGLRLDAVHTIYDDSAISFWELLNDKVQQLEQATGWRRHLVAESDLNSTRVVRPAHEGGYGFEAQWLDDFHHALYTLLDEKGRVRYEDYGSLEQLAKAYREGFVLTGDWVAFRKKKFGASSAGVPGNRFVVFNQNHDQVGNRVRGERLSLLVDFDRLKLAAAALLLSPYVPMLFMGEEYGEENPFYYFVSHGEERLIAAVREGRKKDFQNFGGEGEYPDPQSEKTFTASVIDWDRRQNGRHGLLLDWYRELIGLRKQAPVFNNYDKASLHVETIDGRGLLLQRGDHRCLFNISNQPLQMPWNKAAGTRVLYSGDPRWSGQQLHRTAPPSTLAHGDTLTLEPFGVAVYRQER